MHPKNEDKFSYARIDKWHGRGYTGKGVRIAVAERIDESDNHGRSCADIIKQIAPDAITVGKPRPAIQVINDEITVESENRYREYYNSLVSEGIHILSMSLHGRATPRLEALEREILLAAGLTLIVSAGNDGVDIQKDRSAHLPTWISVGAAGLQNGRPFRIHYSQTGPALDFMAFTSLYTTWGKPFGGTSASCAFAAGQYALWFQWFFEVHGRYPTFQESLAFGLANAEDMDIPGRDNLTGHGLFRLPEEVPAIVHPSKPEIPVDEEERNEETVILPEVNLDTKDRRLTKNFMLHELWCRHCQAFQVSTVSVELVARLQALRDRLDKPVIVTSGYRCPAHDRAVGTSNNPGQGPHVQGYAADIWVAGVSVDELAETAKAVGFTGIGRYYKKGFVHVDLRKPPAEWVG